LLLLTTEPILISTLGNSIRYFREYMKTTAAN